jgi:hypothetical protein
MKVHASLWPLEAALVQDPPSRMPEPMPRKMWGVSVGWSPCHMANGIRVSWGRHIWQVHWQFWGGKSRWSME